MTPTLSEIASALRGKVQGQRVLAPGPGHSHKDRSLSIRLSDRSPDGFVVHSHAGDDWRDCRDYVAEALGLPADRWRTPTPLDPIEAMQRREQQRKVEELERAEIARRQARARKMWEEAGDPRETVVEAYLNRRGLELPDDIAGAVLRFHPRCPWERGTMPAMVAAIRCVETGNIVGIHRTALAEDGSKVGRMVYGTASRGAVMLDPYESVQGAVTVGEGIETCMTARQIGLGPVWSLISTSNIAALPPLPNVSHLTALAERDTAPSQPSATAFEAVARRWHAAGRTVERIWPPEGCGDLNDSIRRDRA
ncbi:toprim domain-containing protein [Methylobacterium sp. J-076]|uniref:DUF7146 domain-containing protein n=1 Tax=Methylobacterium sp. J-076 TaxID=2836655 RepID=UPI001FBC056C|nr:toprim domain-containing protein [Methylobacterium sp. J-076]MCJ2012672.1 toprim domain-containing protein [Methylobacterium sp. J-076]